MKKFTFLTLIVFCWVSILEATTTPNVKKPVNKEFIENKIEKKTLLKKFNDKDVKKKPAKRRELSSRNERPVVLKTVKNTQEEFLVDEDFSKFILGTEAVPDATDITDPETGVIPASYTQTEGWEGAGVFQAGGSAFIGIVDWGDEHGEAPGCIVTPYYDASGNSGNYTLKFKARTVSSSGDNLEVYWNNSENYEGEYVQITNSWQEYTVEISGGDELSYIDIYGYESEFYIDDIKIMQEGETGVSAPTGLPASNVTETGFTANWKAVTDASAYLLSVYSYEQSSGTQEITVKEGFDQINLKSDKLIDTTNPNYPEGWTIDIFNGSNSRHIYKTNGNYLSAPLSLCFDDTGDQIVTPLLTAPMTKLSLWVKGQSATGSTINVEVYNGGSWQSIAKLNVADYNKGAVVNLTDKLTIDALQARFVYNKSAGNCSIDDISYSYGGVTTTIKYLFEEKEVTDTSYDVSGITADTQYYYKVKATDGTNTSKYSNEIKVEESDEPEGLEAPVMLAASNVTDAGFTANWQAVRTAEGYVFYTYLTHIANENQNYELVNEDFNSVTADDSPESLMDYPDDFTKRPDWVVYVPEYNDGMLGFSNDLAGLGIPGMLISPVYELSENVKITLEISAVSEIGDELYVSNIYGEGDEDAETDSKAFTAENQNFTFEFNSNVGTGYIGNLFIIESTTENITYIDEVKITLEMNVGNSVILPYYYEETDLTTTNVSTEDKTEGDSYSYSAYAYAYDESIEDYIFSDYSERMLVSESTDLNDVRAELQAYVKDNNLHIILEKEEQIEIYNISGQMQKYLIGSPGENVISLPQSGIYIVKTGKHNIKVVK